MEGGRGSDAPARPAPAARALAELMAGKPHPEKDRTSGYSGFAEHDDPAASRNVSIRPLD